MTRPEATSNRLYAHRVIQVEYIGESAGLDNIHRDYSLKKKHAITIKKKKRALQKNVAEKKSARPIRLKSTQRFNAIQKSHINVSKQANGARSARKNTVGQ